VQITRNEQQHSYALKGFLQGPSVKRTKELLKLNRNQLRLVTGLLTGQSPERTPLQNGSVKYSHMRNMHRKRWISHTHPMRSWGHSLLKISTPGPILHETRWLSRCPCNKYTTLHPTHNRSMKGRGARAGLRPTPRASIQSFILMPLHYLHDVYKMESELNFVHNCQLLSPPRKFAKLIKHRYVATIYARSIQYHRQYNRSPSSRWFSHRN
jgi:hypothetical protein